MSRTSTILDLLNPISSEIVIYEETADEETAPDNYIIFAVDKPNTTKLYADGKPFLKQSSCEINVFTSNNANSEDGNKYFAQKIEDILTQAGITYNEVNLGFLSDLGKSQITFEFLLIY